MISRQMWMLTRNTLQNHQGTKVRLIFTYCYFFLIKNYYPAINNILTIITPQFIFQTRKVISRDPRKNQTRRIY